jgi:hypothetical protein
MQIRIGEREWWPVIELDCNGHGYVVDVPDALVSRYQAALAEWQEIQKQLDPYCEPLRQKTRDSMRGVLSDEMQVDLGDRELPGKYAVGVKLTDGREIVWISDDRKKFSIR